MVESASPTMATGTNLVFTTAENKGAVGLLFQIHETNIGFVTAHLPSDTKGKSKLAKRNASVDTILKEIVLASEDAGFDLQLQHDHIVIMGDLNYRMDTVYEGDGDSALTTTAEAMSKEKQAMGSLDDWMDIKYNLLRSTFDRQYPSEKQQKMLKYARTCSYDSWENISKSDEMRRIMGDGNKIYLLSLSNITI